MAAPTRYDRQYDFQGYQTLYPTTPLPANQVDAEYNAVKITTDEIIDDLGLIQRADGALQNKIVTKQALADDVSLGFRAPTAWASSTVYAVDDTVFSEAKFYRCVTAHTSSASFSTDLSAAKWSLIADLTLAVIQGSTVETVVTLTGGQTVVSVTYSGVVEVFLNGVKLVNGTDFTASNGTTIVLTTGATNGDIMAVRVFDSFTIANTYTQSQADARFAQLSGATFTGNIQINATFGVSGVVSLASTSHMQLPSGLTSERPSVPTSGNFRYNTTLSRLEIYENAAWRQKANVDNETFTGTTTIATLSTTGNATFAGLLTVAGVVTYSSTSHWVPPGGNTAARPGSPAEGYSRYNTTLHSPEFYDGTAWRQSVPQAVAAGFKHLRVTNVATAFGDTAPSTPNSQIKVLADAITLEDSNGFVLRVNNVSLTVDSSVSGANGLDTGAVANSTWYSIWVIYNPTTSTTAALLSTSATAPTMPSGYSFKARVGWNRTNASAQFNRVLQIGRRAQYVVSSTVTTALPQMIAGGSGSISTPTWTAVAVSNYVPPTAAAIIGVASQTGNGTNQNMLVAPNNNYGNATSTTNPPPVQATCFTMTGGGTNMMFTMNLESTNIYYAAATGGAYLHAAGWEDSLS